jgi:acetyl esterase/lipase
MPIEDTWFYTDDEITQALQLNKKLAWLPRFRIRDRVTPILIQTLLRASQLGGEAKLTRQGLRVESPTVRWEDASVAVRIIHAPGAAKGIVLDIHGGGWVIGNARMNDARNAALAIACGVTVVSVDYRLALATPIEGLMDDCLTAARWLLGNAGFAHLPVIIIGESAGAHLAATTLLRLKDWPDSLRRVVGAVLYYGVYDLTGTPSVRAAGRDTLVLDGPGMVAAFRRLTPGLSDLARGQPPLSPLHGDFAGFPPALLFAGALDPLRDDSVSMAERWAGSAAVEWHLLPASPHGFIHFPTDLARRVLSASQAWICQRLAASHCAFV